jgi:hypothetical protein
MVILVESETFHIWLRGGFLRAFPVAVDLKVQFPNIGSDVLSVARSELKDRRAPAVYSCCRPRDLGFALVPGCGCPEGASTVLVTKRSK